MTLGDTIALRPERPAGTWSIQSSSMVLDLSSRAAVRVLGGGLLGANQPRRLTVELGPRGRGESLAALRRDLLPFVRPEAGGLTLSYAGKVRTVSLPCRYVEGLDALRLTLVARSSTWRAFADTESGMIEGTLTLGTPTPITPQGTAGTPPWFLCTFAAAGALTSIENGVVGVDDLAYTILFGGEQPGVGAELQVDCARVMVVPAAYLKLVQPGSAFSSFRLVGGVENILAVAGANLSTVRYGYYPRFWSWEDADV